MTVPTIIETPEGPIPIPVAIPQESSQQLHIPHVSFGLDGSIAGYVWNDVSSWVKAGWKGVTGLLSGAASLTESHVVDMIDSAIDYAQTAWSSFVNLSVDWTTTVANHLYDIVDALQSYQLSFNSFLLDTINNLQDIVAALPAYVDGRIWDAVRGIEGEIQTIENTLTGRIVGAIAGVEAWAIDNIYNPLLGDLERAIDRVDGLIVDGVADAERYARDLVNNEALRRAAAIAALAGIVAAIGTEVSECLEPMCEAFGPNTNLFNALKALETLLEALAGVALAGVTEPELERWAHTLAGVAASDIGPLVTGFAEGSETVGAAAGGLLGTIGADALAILADLGVPVG